MVYIMPPGQETPLHRHDSEEIVVVISGRDEAISDAGTAAFEAPCTLVLPAGQLHQLRNTGNEDFVSSQRCRSVLGSRMPTPAN